MSNKSPSKIQSDLERLDSFTDEDIRRQIADDPDAAPDLTTIENDSRFRRVNGSPTVSQQPLPPENSE